MRKTQISAYIALFVVLLIGVIINIFPILSINPLSVDEESLFAVVNNMVNGNIEVIFNSSNGGNIVTGVYAYIVRLLLDITQSGNSIFWLRFPSAALTATLILCLFRFDGTAEKLGNSFIASLVFMVCVFVSLFCFRASPILIPSVLTILSLVSLYHWLRRPNKRNILLMSLAVGANIILLGIPAILIVGVVAILFLATTRIGSLINWAKLIIILLIASLFAFLAIFVITGERELAFDVFKSTVALSSINYNGNSSAFIFLVYALLALFPWSLPLMASLVWAIRNFKEVKSRFENLKLLQRFGAAIFLVSLPFFFFYSQFSFILLMASVFFNSPLIGRTLLSQFNHHPDAWRITGKIFASMVILVNILYILLNSGVDIPLMPFNFVVHHWEFWNILLLTAMAVSLYTLSRNRREVTRNHRYFYNIIVLYLLAQNLVIGYIIPNITF